MRRIASLLVALVLPLMAQAQANRPFDATDLTQAEARFVQAALVIEGTYLGLLDGKWGKGSQAALERALRSNAPTYRDLAPLLRTTQAEITRAGWKPFFDAKRNLSFHLPFALLTKDDTAKDPTLRSADNGFVARVMARTLAETTPMHEWLVSKHTGPAQLYTSRKSDGMITAGQLESGKTVYLRSEIQSADVYTLLLQAEPAEAARAQLAAASFVLGPQDALALPSNGLLIGLLGGTAPVQAAPPPPSSGGGISSPGGGIAGQPAPPPAPPPSTGIGVVTAPPIISAAPPQSAPGFTSDGAVGILE